MSNSPPVGSVTITGGLSQGQCLVASNNIQDADGLGTVTYQWYINGVLTSTGYKSEYYVTQQSDVGKSILVKANYTDGAGNAEVVSSQITAAVTNVNDSPNLINLIFPGSVRIDLGGLEDVVCSILQDDGKILVGGSSDFNGALIRLNADGSLDTSFDNDGKLILGSSLPGKIQSITQLSNGQLLVGGTRSVTSGGTTSTSLQFIRLNPDGSIDNTYGVNGKAILNGYQYIFNAALQEDGSVYISANKNVSTNDLIKLTASGSIDESFGAHGILEPGGRSGFIVLHDKTIFVARFGEGDSSQGYQFSLLKYEANGQVMSRMAVDEITNKTLIDFLCSMGSQTIKPTNATDILTSSFGVFGDNVDFIIHRWLWPTMDLFQLRLQSNDQVTGFLPSTVGANAEPYLDKSFGSEGLAVGDISRFDVPKSLLVQVNGKILLVGNVLSPTTGSFRLNYYTDAGGWSASGSGGGGDIGIIRFNVDGSIDPTFGTASTAFIAVNFTEGNPPVTLCSTVKVSDIDARAQGNYEGCTLVIQRLGGVSKKDSFTLETNGTPFTLSSSNYLNYLDKTVGYFVSEGGRMTLNFTGVSATEAVVNQVLQHIQYQNISGTPPPFLKMEWTFSDGVATSKGLSALVIDNIVDAKSSLDRLLVSKWNDRSNLVDIQLQEGVPHKTAPVDRSQSGITLSDVLSVLKIYLGKISDDLPPYKFIAADFNADGVVSLSDVLSLLKYYLGKNTGDLQPEWVFINANSVEQQSNHQVIMGANGEILSKSNTLATLPDVDTSIQEKIELIGVLRGDLDGSWTAI